MDATAQRRPLPPEGLFVISAVSQYIGASIAVSVFDRVAPQTVGWLRVVGASVALLLIARPRPSSWGRERLMGAAVFGIATAAMNLFFYLAIARIDLGKSVAIEFIGLQAGEKLYEELLVDDDAEAGTAVSTRADAPVAPHHTTGDI